MSVDAQRPRERPKPFADDWRGKGTPRPPTTVANALGGAGRIEEPSLAQVSIGARFRAYTLDELATLPSVDAAGGIDLSPDGGEVAFAWDRSGALEVYTAPLVGDRIIQLTEAASVSSAPRWSPDGRWVALLRRDGERDAIHLVDRDGGRDHRLTRGAGYRGHAWSPDGRSIAATTDGGDVVLVDASSGDERRVARGSQPCWSPDGSWLAFTSGDDIAVVSASGGEPRALGTRDAGGRSKGARWSPDGSYIAYTISDRGRREVAFAAVAGGRVTRIERTGATPFESADPVWRPDARGVVYRRIADGNVSLRRVFTMSHADDAVMDVPASFGSPCVARDSESVVAVISESTRPSDVVIRAKGAIDLARITSSLAPDLDPGALVEPATVRYGDGQVAIVYVPYVEAGRPRGVVNIARAALRRWDALAQVLASEGHVAVVTDGDASAALAATPFASLAVRRVEPPDADRYLAMGERVAALNDVRSGVESR